MSCTPAITADLQNTDTFAAWVSRVSTQLGTIATNPNPTIDDINNLTYTIAPDVKAHQDCISSLSVDAAGVSTDVSNLMNSLSSLQGAIIEREGDVIVTHDRAAMARNPELTRGYYDGWFPISRPLKHYTIPLLISLALFLFALSFFFLLSLFGLNVELATYIPKVAEGSVFTYGSKSLYTSRPFLIMAGISVVLIGLTIYGFTRKT
jgi:sensor histidine kinase YesM